MSLVHPSSQNTLNKLRLLPKFWDLGKTTSPKLSYTAKKCQNFHLWWKFPWISEKAEKIHSFSDQKQCLDNFKCLNSCKFKVSLFQLEHTMSSINSKYFESFKNFSFPWEQSSRTLGSQLAKNERNVRIRPSVTSIRIMRSLTVTAVYSKIIFRSQIHYHNLN